ncbi:hypothetical protein SDC9_173784 [bioreactor metagenome]|uniref:Uncharacterized protein n=1 Tax=bioreactor metagenome TaxID=1076179 RepID=A0A645GJN7_9ZZZZ
MEADSGQGGYGGWGIYLDEGSSNISVKNNLVYECGSQGFHQHYGENNHVTGNIFALNKEGQIQVSNRDINRSVYFDGNIVVANNQTIFSSASDAQHDDNNLYWDYTRQKLIKSGNAEMIKAHGVLWMRSHSYYNDALIADPLFKNIENHDFTLAENSPATSFGFQPWNYLNAGTLTKF